MRFRKLRIAFSATCLVACVLLVVLWVRSYSLVDAVLVPISTNRTVEIGSAIGTMAVGLTDTAEPNQFFQLPADEWVESQESADLPVPSAIWGGVNRSGGELAIAIPDWFLVVLVAGIGVVPWMRRIKWRFGLRTLLFATTLVAVVLGAFVWAVS